MNPAVTINNIWRYSVSFYLLPWATPIIFRGQLVRSMHELLKTFDVKYVAKLERSVLLAILLNLLT
jgi:hypothetical protein